MLLSHHEYHLFELTYLSRVIHAWRQRSFDKNSHVHFFDSLCMCRYPWIILQGAGRVCTIDGQTRFGKSQLAPLSRYLTRRKKGMGREEGLYVTMRSLLTRIHESVIFKLIAIVRSSLREEMCKWFEKCIVFSLL